MSKTNRLGIRVSDDVKNELERKAISCGLVSKTGKPHLSKYIRWVLEYAENEPINRDQYEELLTLRVDLARLGGLFNQYIYHLNGERRKLLDNGLDDAPNIILINNFEKAEKKFEKFLIKQYGHTRDEIVYFKNRFLSQNYLNQAKNYSYQQEAVVKIICSGRGRKHLKFLLNYIARNHDYQKEETDVDVYNSQGEKMRKDDFDSLIKDWGDRFSNNGNVDEEIIKASEENERIESMAFEISHEGTPTNDEAKLLLLSRKFHDCKSVSKELYDGAFVFNKKNNQYGYLSINKKQEKEFLTLDNESEIINSRVDLNSLNNIGHSLKRSSNRIEKDFIHMVFSTGGDNPNKRNSKAALEELLAEKFGNDDREYFYAMHDDTQNLHFHVVVEKSSKRRDVQKLSFNKYDLLTLRYSFGQKLDGYGINRSTTLSYDRENYIEILKQKAGQFKQVQGKWWDYKTGESNNLNFDALKAQRDGYQRMSVLIEALEKYNQYDAAFRLRKEQKKFTDMNEDQVLEKVIKMTTTKTENEAKDFRITLKREMQKKKEARNKSADEKRISYLVNDYYKHLKETENHLKNIDYNKASREIRNRIDTSIEYIDEKKEELDREFSQYLVKDKGRGH